MPTKVVFVKKNQSDLDKQVEAAEAVEVTEAAIVNEGPSRLRITIIEKKMKYFPK